MQLVTYSTRPLDPESPFMASCRKWGWQPIVLGTSEDSLEGTPHHLRHHTFKLFRAREYYRTLPPDTLVFNTDAWDVFLQGGPDEVDLTAFSRPIIFGAERNLWPADLLDVYPPSPTPYRFLNAGGYIGPAGLLALLLRDCDSAIGDQEWWANTFLAHRNVIELDYECRIFQPMYGYPAYPCNSIPPELQFEDGRWRNTLTGTMPTQFHGSAGGVGAVAEMWNKAKDEQI